MSNWILTSCQPHGALCLKSNLWPKKDGWYVGWTKQFLVFGCFVSMDDKSVQFNQSFPRDSKGVGVFFHFLLQQQQQQQVSWNQANKQQKRANKRVCACVNLFHCLSVCLYNGNLTSTFLLHCLLHQTDDVIFCDLLLFLRDDAMATKGIIPFSICIWIL